MSSSRYQPLSQTSSSSGVPADRTAEDKLPQFELDSRWYITRTNAAAQTYGIQEGTHFFDIFTKCFHQILYQRYDWYIDNVLRLKFPLNILTSKFNIIPRGSSAVQKIKYASLMKLSTDAGEASGYFLFFCGHESPEFLSARLEYVIDWTTTMLVASVRDIYRGDLSNIDLHNFTSFWLAYYMLTNLSGAFSNDENREIMRALDECTPQVAALGDNLWDCMNAILREITDMYAINEAVVEYPMRICAISLIHDPTNYPHIAVSFDAYLQTTGSYQHGAATNSYMITLKPRNYDARQWTSGEKEGDALVKFKKIPTVFLAFALDKLDSVRYHATKIIDDMKESTLDDTKSMWKMKPRFRTREAKWNESRRPNYRRENLERIARKFEREGFSFSRMPNEVYGSMPYNTAYTLSENLAKTDEKPYGYSRLLQLAQEKIIPSFRIGKQVIFDAAAIVHLKTYQHRSLDELGGKRKLGWRKHSDKQATA